jgi:thioester reductase-like protein
MTTAARHLLLTGATGLLGRYVLRNLILSGHRVTVLARSLPGKRARDRICSLMRETLGSESCPGRQVTVVEGDVRFSRGGVKRGELSDLRLCDAVVHCAASLVFEPAIDEDVRRTNVGGTRNVTELCKAAGITELHHVSTAYVCGQRTGTILESERNLGQRLNNAYEISKLEAEEAVVSSRDVVATIYRPGVIVGDSKTGFTSTFRSFYSALRAAHLIGKLNETNRIPLAVRLNLGGEETNAFVPVDWVADAMCSIIDSPKYHGKTYHLTPANMTSMRTISDVLRLVTGVHYRFVGQELDVRSLNEAERIFYHHVRNYSYYWRTDPSFDRTNTLLATPDLACPIVDKALLVRLAKWALDARFRRVRQTQPLRRSAFGKP